MKKYLLFALIILTILVGCDEDSIQPSLDPAHQLQFEPSLIIPSEATTKTVGDIEIIPSLISPTEDSGQILTQTITAESMPAPSYLIQPGDEKLLHGLVFLDIAEFLLPTHGTIQIRVAGSLPTTCHQLRADGMTPDKHNQIHILLYSLSAPEMMCAQVLSPFDELLTIEGLSPGTYSVWVNDKLVGDITL